MSILTSPIPIGVRDGRIANTDSPAGIPREDRVPASKMAQYIIRQHQNGMMLRKLHAISWMKVKSILRGIHYYSLRGGVYHPLKQKQGQINSVIPIMKPLFRQELGRLNSNSLGVSTLPAAQDVDSIGKADRAYNMLTHWIEESRAPEFFDDANQKLLIEGMVGYHYTVDELLQQVFLSAVPASKLFPIPFDAKSELEMYGLMVVDFMSQQWLEQQDEETERMISQQVQDGERPQGDTRKFRRMAALSGRTFSGMSLDFPMFGASIGEASRIKGALVRTVWMKPTQRTPNGEYMFMVEDQLFRYNATDGLTHGKVPVELVWYTKKPDDWWGDSFCEELIAPQHMANRQASNWEHQAKYNRSMFFYDPSAIDKDKVQIQDKGPFIPFQIQSYERKVPPIIPVPPVRVSRDVPALFALSRDIADNAAGYRSNILFGQAEGRNEGGPANQLLQQNAQATILPVLDRIYNALSRVYPAVLDLLHDVWPEDKQIRVSSPNNVGRMLKYIRDQRPWSQEVIIKPIPLLPNGRNTLTSMLMQLKQLPNEEGKQGGLVSDQKFLRSLRIQGLLPPGLEMEDESSNRIQSRINRLINDTIKPAVDPADPTNPDERLGLEDHREAVRQLRKAILDDTFMTYSPDVQRALVTEMRFHSDRLQETNAGPNAFDDDDELFDALQIEQYLSAAEADFETQEGEFQLGLRT